MEELASMRYKIINTMLETFLEQERKFFGTCFSLINNFYNELYKLRQDIPYKQNTYDPMKYTRATKIMEGVDTNSLPQLKMKDKYSFNYSKNINFQRANSCATNNNMNNICNNNISFNKKFSYEDYKMRKSSIDNPSKTQNKTNNITTFSNNNDENNEKTNPYSYEAYKKRTQSLGNTKRPLFNNNINNDNYYNNNINIVMNSIMGEEKTVAKNPFGDIINDNSNKNPYSSINHNSIKNNPYETNNKNETYNPYSNIFNSSNNNNGNVNNMFKNAFGNKGNNQQNYNDNNRNRKPKDPYNFGF